MKVVHINAYYKYGSTGSILYDIHNYLLKSKYKSYIIYGKNRLKNDNKNIIFCGNKYSFIIHKVLYHFFGNPLAYSYFETKKIIKKLDLIKPDIIHLHNLHDYYINNKLLFNYIIKNKVKVVWTFHDCWAFTGHCCHYKTIECNKWQTECSNCPLQRKGPRSMIFDRSKEFYYKKKVLFNKINDLEIICVSDWLKNETQKSFLGNKSIHRIYNWIDTNIFYPEKKDKIDKIKKELKIGNKFVILGISFNWVKQKGIYDFIELSKRLDDNYVIVLVGNLVNNKIYDKNNMYFIPSNIIVLPPSQNTSLLRLYYSMANVFINPSEVETFGLTTAESLACGTPAIVYDNTASPEIVGLDGKCGEVIKYDENRIDNMIYSINRIKDSSSYKKECLARVNKKFLSNNIKQYISIYRRLYEEK